MLLTCQPVSASEARDRYFFVNAVVQVDKSESVDNGQAIIEAEALRWAAKIIENSPDSVIVSKQGLNLARDVGRGALGIDEVTVKSFESEMSNSLRDGENIREGITAFFQVSSTKSLLLSLIQYNRNANRLGQIHLQYLSPRLQSCR